MTWTADGGSPLPGLCVLGVRSQWEGLSTNIFPRFHSYQLKKLVHVIRNERWQWKKICYNNVTIFLSSFWAECQKSPCDGHKRLFLKLCWLTIWGAASANLLRAELETVGLARELVLWSLEDREVLILQTGSCLVWGRFPPPRKMHWGWGVRRERRAFCLKRGNGDCERGGSKGELGRGALRSFLGRSRGSGNYK